MRVPASVTGLGTRVAMRTFALFCACAVVPIILSAVIADHAVSTELRKNAAADLTATGKSYGLLVFERLRETDEVVSNLAGLVLHRRMSAQDLYAFSSRRFRVVNVDTHSAIGESTPAADDRNETQVRLLLSGKDHREVRLAITTGDTHQQVTVTVALLDDYLWDTDALTLHSTEICVRTTQAITLRCVGEPSGNADLLTRTWTLYLPPRYRSSEWILTARQPTAIALQALISFRHTLPILTLIAIGTAVLLSIIQIRRSHHPLSLLTSAARLIGKRRLDQRVEIHSNDEYANLGRAFNRMSAGLSRQFYLHRTMARIDRMILADPSTGALMKRILPALPRILRESTVAVVIRSGSEVVAFIARAPSPTVEVVTVDLSAESLEFLAELSLGEAFSLSTVNYRTLSQALGASAVYGTAIKIEDKIKGALVVHATHRLSNAQRRHVRSFAQRFSVAFGSEERRQTLLRQAYYDELTALPNRQLFRDRLQQLIAHARHAQTEVAVIYIDLDRFKNINDSMGHSAGDTLLQAVSQRLSAVLRDTDTLARMGGDEFVVVSPDPRMPAHILAERLQASLSEPFDILGARFFIAASLGVTLFPRDGEDAEALLRNADIAMYRAKAAGRGSIACFETVMNLEAQKRLDIEQRLRVALKERKLHLLYQPKISLLDGSLQGVEALARWNDDVLGPVSPTVFITVAEECGLIEELGAWALREACETFQTLRAGGVDLRSISVNASMRQLRERRFIQDVNQALALSGMPATALEIEVTETMVADNPQLVASRLNELRASGVRVAIDDFGTGYSSMAALGTLPMDVLKIDRTFVTDCGISKESTCVAEAIISMAHILGKSVVAEGVETSLQLQTLKRLGCDFAQGFLFAPPMAARDLQDLAATIGLRWPIVEHRNVGDTDTASEFTSDRNSAA